ncbi:uncharacterized protein LOC110459501 [Mizuhopecten yessoensis]|uniref:uncharacterized protein LOC110459501 n=1 Tax=Mizuhopecten yessoensis TaxID=6573 RepID=UPI000B45BE11|nr:uncharacterized protein LOC110459501 [Mizuhopecten yessoensis]
MAPKRSTSRIHPYDSTNPANWTAKQLKEELSKKGITVSHSSITRAALIQMYKDNCLLSVSRPSSLQTNVNNGLGDRLSRQTGQTLSSFDSDVTNTHSATVTDAVVTRNQRRPLVSLPQESELCLDADAEPSFSLGDARSDLARTSPPSDRATATCAAARRDSTSPPTNMAAPIHVVPDQDTASILTRTLSLMEMTFKAFQSTQLATSAEPAFDMMTAYTNLRNIRSGVGDNRTSGATLDTLRQHADSDGIPADLLPQIDIVSPALRKKIIQGVPESSTSCQQSPMSLPRVLSSNVELNQTVNDLWDSALTSSTRGVYHTGFTAYKTFLLLSGVNWLCTMPPVSEDLLMFFVAHCFKTLNIKASTIKLYLCGIRYSYMRAGHANPLVARDGQAFIRLNTILNGVKKQQGVTRKPRLPITFNILEKICLLLRSGVFSPFLDVMMETACTVAFFGFLRCGEFCVTGAFDPTRHLCMEDVNIDLVQQCVHITLKVSKCDPFRKGISIVLYSTCKSVCPYTTLKRYLSLRTTTAGRRCTIHDLDPFFVTDSGSPLSRTTFISYLRTVISRLGLDDRVYSGHSFRIGAATSAANSQIEDHLIKTLGRWSSDCYQRYIHTSRSTIKSAQRSLTVDSRDHV